MRISFLNLLKPAVWLLMIGTFFTACNRLDIYEKNISVPDYKWQYAFQPGFDFDITDTASQYNIFIVLRHTDSYRYNNIWLNVGIKAPGDTATTAQRLDLQLGNDVKGWEGTGMDDIWEVRRPATKAPVQFKKPGTYHFTIAQVMRENPLPNVMSVGVRVERVK
ncbi:MAG: gliding motility lipoprotein GldH [Chitinophagaceae bacterium]|nr:gliding motility lipoprotein GldH [Chitinophagaceae bacterium]